MIGVSEGKDQEARAILELAGIDSDKYRIWHHNMKPLTVHFVTISVRISQSWRTGSAEKGRRKHGNRRKQRS